MEMSQVKKLVEAIDTVGIKWYKFVTDMSGNFINNDYCFNVIDEANDLVYNFARNSYVVGAEPGPATIHAAAPVDLHECVIGDSAENIIKLAEELGITLTNEQKRMILRFDKGNYTIIPETGDYHPFKELTEEEYEQLSDEEKAAYDAAKKHDIAVKTGINQGFAVRVEV
jgi:hypothetical protein